MAQAGFSPIILFHSTTATNAPTTANLAVGEVALNIADGKLYYTDGTTVSYFTSSTGTVATATNLAGGGALQVPYQSAAGTTAFIAAPTVSGTALTYNGTGLVWAAVGGTTTNALTVNDGGAGTASPFTFDGSAAQTISYNSVGAPKADGTGASGTWSISISGTAAKATNVAGGLAGSIPYQTAADTTALLAIGTNGQVLTVSAGGLPVWASVGTATTATNLAGGGALQVPFQSAASTTSFVAAPTVTNSALIYDGTNLVWGSPTATTATNLAGGAAGSFPYQSAANTTSFLAPGTAGQVMISGGAGAPTWANGSITFGATAAALGSTVSAFDAVTIGQTTAAAGTFTTLIAEELNVTASTIPANGVYLPAANTVGIASNTSLAMSFNPNKIGSIYAALNEQATVSATAATGAINFYAGSQSVLYYTTNASANFTLNFAGTASATLDSSMAVGQSMSLTFLNTNGATAYYLTAITIDGNAQTVKWQGGTAPSAGNASSVDAYTFAIIKTAAATFTVIGSQTQFA